LSDIKLYLSVPRKLLLTEAEGFRSEELTMDRELPIYRLYIDMIEHKETRFLEAVKNPRKTNYTVDFLLIKRNCNN
jgi:hypothetical protein